MAGAWREYRWLQERKETEDGMYFLQVPGCANPYFVAQRQQFRAARL
jgi:hypothetical protein